MGVQGQGGAVASPEGPLNGPGRGFRIRRSGHGELDPEAGLAAGTKRRKRQTIVDATTSGASLDPEAKVGMAIPALGTAGSSPASPPGPGPRRPRQAPPEVDRHGGAAAPDGRPAGRPGRAGVPRIGRGGEPLFSRAMGGASGLRHFDPSSVSCPCPCPCPCVRARSPLVRRHVPGLPSGCASFLVPVMFLALPGSCRWGCRSLRGAREKRFGILWTV